MLHVRHDKAGVDALIGHLDLDDHAARARPGASLVTRRVEAGDLAPLAPIGPFGLLDHVARQCLQDSIAGQTGAITEVGLGLDPLHHLRVGKVAVTAKDQQGVGPCLTQPLDQACQHREHLRAGEALGLEDGGDQAS
jgi:hypothetical protein